MKTPKYNHTRQCRFITSLLIAIGLLLWHEQTVCFADGVSHPAVSTIINPHTSALSPNAKSQNINPAWVVLPCNALSYVVVLVNGIYIFITVLGCIYKPVGFSGKGPPWFPSIPAFVKIIKPADGNGFTMTTTSLSPSSFPSYYSSMLGWPAGTLVTNPVINGISLWQYTNSFYDSNLNVDWTGATICNFSVLTSPDLSHWTTLYTVVGWVTSYNIKTDTNAWVCEVVYTNSVTTTGGVTVTNGVPISTNWIQCQIAPNPLTGGTLTNLIVYSYGPLPPVTNSAPKQFYQSWCNSNDIVTVGP